MSTQILSTQDCRKRWGILGLFATPLIGAIPYSQGYHLPFLRCPILHLTGIPCPTCGMTRSFTAVVQGRWELATDFHLFGPILFFLLAGIIIHLVIELNTKRRLSTFYTRLITSRDLQFSAIAAYLGYYLLRLLVLGFPDNIEVAFAVS